MHSVYGLLGNFCEGLASVSNGYKFGFIDNTSSEVIPCIYEDADFFCEGLAKVSILDGKKGYIDKTGKMVLAF